MTTIYRKLPIYNIPNGISRLFSDWTRRPMGEFKSGLHNFPREFGVNYPAKDFTLANPHVDRWYAIPLEGEQGEKTDLNVHIVKTPAPNFLFTHPARSEFDKIFVSYEHIAAKAIALLTEAHAKGNYRELMTLPVTDPRHPFHYEHPHVAYLKARQYIHIARSIVLRQIDSDWWYWSRRHQQWAYDMLGILTDDVPNAEESFVQEALRRVPYADWDARQRRCFRALSYLDAFEVLPEDQWIHPLEDIAYYTPYAIMSLYEFREGISESQWYY
jgi:hypothetical protein